MDKPNISPSVSWGECQTEDQFMRRVAENYGTDVRDACRRDINQRLQSGQDADAVKILNALRRATRQVDVAKNRLRVRFTQ